MIDTALIPGRRRKYMEMIRKHILTFFLLSALGATAQQAEIEKPLVKIVMVGDSTMCEYAQNLPDRGWGMFLEEAFKAGRVNVHNLARKGRSTKTFIEEKLWEKALALRPDYVIIQFGHNDSHDPENRESTDAKGDYREYLRQYINDSRAIGATPILVTPMVRRTFNADGTLDDNLQPYADAMKAVGAEEEVPVIDLHASSWKFFEPLGPDRAQDYARNRKDPTHFNELGARVIVGLVLRDLPAMAPRLSRLLDNVVDVWPEGIMPGDGCDKPERAYRNKKDGELLVTDVSIPTLTFYPVPDNEEALPTVIVCPGGGYSCLAWNLEGTEIAEWLNSIGMNAAILKYRVPDNRDGALQDLQRALSLARAMAQDWNIDPDRLGIIGFSAGGNLCARASTQFGERAYTTVDQADHPRCRPDFVILVYPAYLKEDGQAGRLNLKAHIPPTLIVHNEDDHRFIEGSRLYAAALKKTKHPCDYLRYPSGGHGYGLRCELAAGAWPDDTVKWLHDRGILKAQ